LFETHAFEVNDEMWEKYKATHDPAIRNDILMAYMNIVKINAKRMNAVYRNHVDLEDIVNEGVFVLMDCIEKFKPNLGVKFDTFASIRVRGSIIDYIRKQDWVPRNLRKKAKNIEDTYYELQTQYGRQASDSEVAEKLGIEVAELNKVVGESQGFSVLSYEELIQDNLPIFGEEGLSVNTPEQKIQEDELKRVIAMSIDKLYDNERTVISLYYYDELKLKEIAEVLGLTESRISQIHSKAVTKLKNMIRSYLLD
jgi:RNA polymerase sigma factor FliA